MSLRLIYIFLLLAAADNAFASETKCTYCGSWLPLPSFSKRIPGEFFLISHNQISLPSCDPVKADLILEDKEISYPLYDNATDEPVRAVYSIDIHPTCKNKLPVKGGGLVLQLELRPRDVINREDLIVEIYEHSALDQVLLTPKDSRKKIGKPGLVNRWWMIRWDHRPCEEGTTYGFKLCDQLLGR